MKERHNNHQKKNKRVDVCVWCVKREREKYRCSKSRNTSNTSSRSVSRSTSERSFLLTSIEGCNLGQDISNVHHIDWIFLWNSMFCEYTFSDLTFSQLCFQTLKILFMSRLLNMLLIHVVYLIWASNWRMKFTAFAIILLKFKAIFLSSIIILINKIYP
jgi:CBS domain containing-hemolysin-like protein